ncbi:MAG: 2-amino-4-hydroxy-6-hydroxymethyldihydropteridine diphosphokinase, partial [Succiniclasticum sp.]|nr:2-amino-4-hydroxy-6-hydroxymethyldihydropteridine diphosphokinase [Succiniclasticum sp.]
SPTELLRVLLQIEQEMGRKRIRRWGERNIDLDLLLYEDRIINLPDLQVPHPDMQNRDFVLRPLVQIAPEAVHPILKKTIRQLWEELSDKE